MGNSGQPAPICSRHLSPREVTPRTSQPVQLWEGKQADRIISGGLALSTPDGHTLPGQECDASPLVWTPGPGLGWREHLPGPIWPTCSLHLHFFFNLHPRTCFLLVFREGAWERKVEMGVKRRSVASHTHPN